MNNDRIMYCIGLLVVAILCLLAIDLLGHYKLSERIEKTRELIEEPERGIVSRDVLILDTLRLLVEEQERSNASQDGLTEIMKEIVELME